MNELLERYLDRVMIYAHRPEPEAAELRRELKDHLLQKIDDLTRGGLDRGSATLEALRRHGHPRVIGYGLRPRFPLLDVRSSGTARGVIAVGPRAVGIVAIGGVATGMVAFGGAALGLVSFGGFALGLLYTFAGFGCGFVANAGFALGVVAVGGFALGLTAAGGKAIGLWVPYGADIVRHYTPSNVPGWLRGLDPLLNVSLFIETHLVVILPLYLVMVFGLMVLRGREERRVGRGEDWLLEE